MTNASRWGRDRRKISDLAFTPLPDIQLVKQHLREKVVQRRDFEDRNLLKEADPLFHLSKTQSRNSAQQEHQT